MIMMPHSGSDMVSAPSNPFSYMSGAENPQFPENTVEKLPDIALAQTRGLRPLLKASRLELAGLRCCNVFASKDLAEITVINASASMANVI